MSATTKRTLLGRAFRPLAVVTLLLSAGIAESQAGDPGVHADTRPVVVFVDPQEPALDDRQRQILAAFRWARTADPAARLHLVNLTDTPWDETGRRRLLAATRLAPDQAVFLDIQDSRPLAPHWPGRKPALAALLID